MPYSDAMRTPPHDPPLPGVRSSISGSRLGPRGRLAFLWVSQTARVFADWCLRLFAILELASLGGRNPHSAAYLVTAVFVAPFIVLAPINGALSNAFQKRWVLITSAGFCFVASVSLSLVSGPTLLLLALFGVGMAVYSPTRYALLPAAAEETGLPLARVTGAIEMGGALAIVGGALLGLLLQPDVFVGPIPAALVAVVAVGLVGFLCAVPVRFASDVWRPEPPWSAVAGFFRDAGRILHVRSACGSLLGLAALMALVTAGSNALITSTLDPESPKSPRVLIQTMGLIALGGVVGSWLASRPGHVARCLGLVPVGATGLLLSLGWAMGADDPTWPGLALGLMTGLVNVPLRSHYQASVPADARGNGMAVMNLTLFIANTSLSVVLFGLTYGGIVGGPVAQLGLLSAVAIGATGVGWWTLRVNVRDLFRGQLRANGGR